MNTLKQDLHDLVQVLGCFADGYSQLRQDVNMIIEAIDYIKEILQTYVNRP